MRFGAQLREENDVAYGMGVGQKHRQAIDADAFAGGWRHPVTKGPDVIQIQLLRRLVSSLHNLRQKPPLLFGRIIELGKAVRDLHTRHVNLEALDQRGIVQLLLGKR
jgi:hypothetical protein